MIARSRYIELKAKKMFREIRRVHAYTIVIQIIDLTFMVYS